MTCLPGTGGMVHDYNNNYFHLSLNYLSPNEFDQSNNELNMKLAE